MQLNLLLKKFFLAFIGSDLGGEINSQLNVRSGVRQLCKSIPIVDDRELEGNETFTVEIMTLPNELVILGSNKKLTVLIIDNGQ